MRSLRPRAILPYRRLLDSFAAQKSNEVLGTVYQTKDLNAVRYRPVEYDHPFETRDAKCPQRSKIRMFQAGMPSHFWLRCKQSECFVGGNQKTVTKFRSGSLREIESLIVEIRVGFRANDIVGIQRLPVFFKRSSSRRCFSYQ